MDVLSRSRLLLLDLQIIEDGEAQNVPRRTLRTGSEEVLQMP